MADPATAANADLLRRIHLVEAWGRGVPLILANAPDVTFREVAGLFIASFARPSARHAGAESAPSKTTPKTAPQQQESPQLHNPSATLPKLLWYLWIYQSK